MSNIESKILPQMSRKQEARILVWYGMTMYDFDQYHKRYKGKLRKNILRILTNTPSSKRSKQRSQELCPWKDLDRQILKGAKDLANFL